MKEKRNSIIESSLEDVLPSSMMPYAESVILDRALPRVEDGLKPVQRRILYSMNELGLSPDKPHKKCARIVGECMGKYHPHGDSSVYDAMVRLAQDFNMRMPLVDGHGNFGSVDGDPAAAMRYTEARMRPLAMELLRDIEKDTVKFNLNFDDTLKEPDTLPGRYPNLLVNGSTGIAVGLATNIPPHNLGEVIDGVVAYIDNPKIKLEEMMKYIKGPDFPTGGYIIADELVTAYETGKGKITMRAKIDVEQTDGGKKNIIITELPFQVNKSVLLKRISELKEEKKDDLAGVADVVDESDRHGMRAVIKLKKDVDVERTIAILLKNTDLEKSYGINMVAIANGKPEQMGLIKIISYYVEYQREIIFRRTKYDLNEAKERCHILEGLIVAVRNIDEVIKIIKGAESVPDARQKLRARFELSEKQAQAILDLRLARLTKLEIFKLEEELKNLKELIKRLTAICESKKLQVEVVKDELKGIKKQYRDERRSRIYSDEKQIRKAIETLIEEKPLQRHFMLTFANGVMKKVPEKNFSMSDKTIDERSTSSDVIIDKFNLSSDKKVLFFTDKGNCYRIPAEELPECKYREKGFILKSVCAECDPKEKVVGTFEESEAEGDLLFVTASGLVKKTARKEYTVAKSSYSAIKLKEGDSVIYVKENLADTTLCYVTEKGMCLNSVKDDIPLQGRISIGVKGVQIADGDKIVYVGQVTDEGELIVASSASTLKKIIMATIEPIGRGRKGVKVLDDDKNKVLFAAEVTEPYDIFIDSDFGFVKVNSDEIAIAARTAKGKNVKLKKPIVFKNIYAPLN